MALKRVDLVGASMALLWRWHGVRMALAWYYPQGRCNYALLLWYGGAEREGGREGAERERVRGGGGSERGRMGCVPYTPVDDSGGGAGGYREDPTDRSGVLPFGGGGGYLIARFAYRLGSKHWCLDVAVGGQGDTLVCAGAASFWVVQSWGNRMKIFFQRRGLRCAPTLPTSVLGTGRDSTWTLWTLPTATAVIGATGAIGVSLAASVAGATIVCTSSQPRHTRQREEGCPEGGGGGGQGLKAGHTRARTHTHFVTETDRTLRTAKHAGRHTHTHTERERERERARARERRGEKRERGGGGGREREGGTEREGESKRNRERARVVQD